MDHKEEDITNAETQDLLEHLSEAPYFFQK